ncbi:MAG TPA: hypothetical protein VK190_04810 [Pseudoneobacillus sp.]|nr:hypothetical protein [Pseudoneobacillus sp.]
MKRIVVTLNNNETFEIITPDNEGPQVIALLDIMDPENLLFTNETFIYRKDVKSYVMEDIV